MFDDWKNSCLCLEDGMKPAAANLINLQSIYSNCLEGEFMAKLIEHHIKYKELHGIDETILMTHGEHVKLHKRLRREGKCNIPADELRKISSAARNRNKTYIEWRKRFNSSTHRKDYIRKYASSDKYQQYIKEYNKMISGFYFNERIMPNVRHKEQITYNYHTGQPRVICRFEATNSKKLYNIYLE